MIKYKLFLRKSSFKKDLENAKLLLKIIEEAKPVNFLEVGVLEGATSRNVCELLNIIHDGKFSYTGIDLFGEDKNLNNLKEYTPISKKFSNPIKWIYFNLIIKMEPNSKKCVEHLLKKFKNVISIYQGYSRIVLNQINLKKIDFVFLDGGHSYDTVKEDLHILTSNLKKNSIIICDDYNIQHYGVKKAVDEIKDNYVFKNYGRFSYLKL